MKRMEFSTLHFKILCENLQTAMFKAIATLKKKKNEVATATESS